MNKEKKTVNGFSFIGRIKHKEIRKSSDGLFENYFLTIEGLRIEGFFIVEVNRLEDFSNYQIGQEFVAELNFNFSPEFLWA